MKAGPFYTFLFLMVLMAACTRMAADTSYTYNPSTDFRQLRTFGWFKAEVPKPIAGSAGSQFNLLLDQRIKEAVASELVKTGMRPEAETPDFLVAYDIAVDTSQMVSDSYTFPSGFGYSYSYWYGYRYRYTTAGLPNYRPIQSLPSGTVVVDIISPDSNQLLWRGYSQTSLNPTSLDEERINLIVADIMAQFPPKPVR